MQFYFGTEQAIDSGSLGWAIEEVRECPAHASATAMGDACRCDIGYQEDPTGRSCEAASSEPEDNMCLAEGVQVGHPIVPATGEKVRFEEDLADGGAAALSFGRIYRSTWASSATRLPSGMGAGWTHSHDMSLRLSPPEAPTAISVVTAEGYARGFTSPGGGGAGVAWTPSNGADRLSPTIEGGWAYTRAEDDTRFVFDGAGRLLSRTERNGWATRYGRDASGRLITVTNPFGRSLRLAYDAQGRIASVTAPDARTVSYAYDAAGRLASVRHPDGRTRGFLYENAAFPNALTGLMDEHNARFATFAYDAQGRAVSTELAGSAERYEVAYFDAVPGMAFVTDPLGTLRSFGYATAAGRLAVTSSSSPTGTAGAGAAAARVQDAHGLVTRQLDFQGAQTNIGWDTTRRLPVSVTRGSDTPQATTTTTEWHPTLALPVRVSEPGRTTSYTYDAQGRVLSQTIGAVAASGSGMSGLPVSQERRWSYDAQGLVATETAPDGSVTKYAYDALGNPTQSTNALGHVTRYTWDAGNRLVGRIAPNGLVTTYDWDARGHLLSQTVGATQTTRTSYTASGEVATLTRPDGLVVTYAYDAAHRLTGWRNNRGEAATYTLDRMGNRVAEQLADATGAVVWRRDVEVNALNLPASETVGGGLQKHSFAYDANGELIAQTDALNQTTRRGLDALRRVSALTDAANATASLGYDAAGALVQVSDAAGVATGYARDALGQPTSETSADIGSRTTQYDALGLPAKLVDALGQATSVVRDALGRPTLVTYADGKTAKLRYDLLGATYNAPGAATASVGYLSELVDRSGTTVYQRDAFGRVVRKTQKLTNGMTQVLATSYTAAGQIDTVTYPAGGGGAQQKLRHVHDATGRLVRLDWNGQALLTNITWTPLGQPAGWTWAGAGSPGSASVATTRSYDAAGRLTRVDVGGQAVLAYRYDAAGRITAIDQLLAAPTNAADPASGVALNLRSWLAGYDLGSRLTSFGLNGTSSAGSSATPATVSTTSFTYDANGNRTASTQTQGALTTARAYKTLANRLTGFTQTTGGVAVNVAYAIDANGNLKSDGLHGYAYDATGRLSSATTGATPTSPTTRYAHNALGQRVFKTEALYPGAGLAAGSSALTAFFAKGWAPSATNGERVGFAYVYDEQGTLMGEYGAGGAKSTGSRQYV